MEDPDPSFMLIGVVLCLLILAFTSAVDAAFTAISRHRLSALRANGGPRAKRAVSRLLDDPYRFKSTILLLNACMLITATALTLRLNLGQSAAVLAGSLVALLLGVLIIGEVIPKALAVRNPTATALTLSGPLDALAQLLWPLVALINLLTRPLFRLLSGQENYRTPLVTEEELRMLVNIGEEEGLIEQEERAMIEDVIAFGDTLVREILVPRVDIVGLEVDTPLEQVLDLVSTSGHSRIPVYNNTIDTVVGVLYAKDLIPALRTEGDRVSLKTLMRPPHFVPETMKVNALLEDMQRRRVHIAIIVDEYGGTAGIATIEDLVEQIVGEILDEYDTGGPSVQTLSEGVFVVDARLPISDVNDLAGLALTSETSDRIGGLFYEQLGRVPRLGDQLSLDDAIFTVTAVNGVRAQKLRIELPRPAEVGALPTGELAEGGLRGST